MKRSFILSLLFILAIPSLKADAQVNPTLLQPTGAHPTGAHPTGAHPTGAHRAEMVGGRFLNLTKSAIALFVSDKNLCSGILVGRKEVLTAAHCLQGATSNMAIVIGDEVFKVSDALVASGYKEGLPTLQNALYDVGIVVLDHEVIRIEPVPILENSSLMVGDSFNVYGFGTNEVSDQYQLPVDYYRSGKMATFVVAQKFKGIFEASNQQSAAAICPGDSGGPAIANIDGKDVVVGITSYSDTKTDINGKCIAGAFAVSGFVDLQSEAAQGFLVNFVGLSRYRHTKPTPTPVPAPSIAQIVPAAPVLAKRGRVVSVTMTPLANVQYLLKVSITKLEASRNKRAARRTKSSETIVVSSSQKSIRLPSGKSSIGISYSYQALDGSGVVSQQSPEAVLRAGS